MRYLCSVWMEGRGAMRFVGASDLLRVASLGLGYPD